MGTVIWAGSTITCMMLCYMSVRVLLHDLPTCRTDVERFSSVAASVGFFALAVVQWAVIP